MARGSLLNQTAQRNATKAWQKHNNNNNTTQNHGCGLAMLEPFGGQHRNKAQYFFFMFPKCKFTVTTPKKLAHDISNPKYMKPHQTKPEEFVCVC
mmetsp:Transcript_68/g.123  ORF Transcript_68/g.123 Transcript_68/m.123 type:complete len:95 (-) Transcript_68:13-297(-)